ncbi:MAG TPA: LPS assembly lipoprotein LptE [Stellaceae bacterium]
MLLTLALGPPLALSGCGWAPLYGEATSGPASEELRAIHVDPISERIGQRLAIALRNSLNPTGEPTPERYRLQTTLSTSLTNLGIQSEGLASLGKLDVYATYNLIDSKSRKTLLVNTVHVANTFNLNPNQYSTVAGEDDTAVRSAAELNQEIVTRLALFMERRLAEQPPAPS